MRYFVCLTLLCLLTVAAVSANTPVTEGTYQYSVAPVNEGEGPVPFGSGILTDGTAANPLGETARWPFSMNIRDVTISFDLLRTYELAEIFLASHCPNEYWGSGSSPSATASTVRVFRSWGIISGMGLNIRCRPASAFLN